MELDFSNRFVFVINKAKVQKGKVVFSVSVKDIDLVNPTGNMNLLTEIPIGSFLNVRFDIDISSPFGDCNNCAPQYGFGYNFQSLFSFKTNNSDYSWGCNCDSNLYVCNNSGAIFVCASKLNSSVVQNPNNLPGGYITWRDGCTGNPSLVCPTSDDCTLCQDITCGTTTSFYIGNSKTAGNIKVVHQPMVITK